MNSCKFGDSIASPCAVQQQPPCNLAITLNALPLFSEGIHETSLTNEIENDFQFHRMIHATSLFPSQESRCLCGNLFACLRQEGMELKCRQCKRMIVTPWGTSATWRRIIMQWQETVHERIHLTSDDHHARKQPRGQRYKTQSPTNESR